MSNRSMTDTGRLRMLTDEQFIRILDLAKLDNYRNYFMILLCGSLGLRVSELIKLRVDDIQNNQMRIPTLKARVEGRTGYHIKKNELPELYIWQPIPSVLVGPLKEYQISYNIKSGWLFPGSDGHLTKTRVQQIFYHYCKLLGIRASIHSLRHYLGDRLYDKHKDLGLVASILRHKSLESTRIYAKPSMEMRREALENITIRRDQLDMMNKKDQKNNT